MLLTNGERSMSIFNPWQSGTAALMALAITTGTTAPLLTTTPASAQLFPRQSTQIAIPTGTSIPVRYEQEKKSSFQGNNALNSNCSSHIVNRSGSVGFQLEVKLLVNCNPPMEAPNLLLENWLYTRVDGSRLMPPRVINQTQVRRGANTGSIVKGAVVGAAAAALEGLTGNRKIGVGDILIRGAGAAGGAILGRKS